MALKNTLITYGSISKFFHWLIFLLVVGMLIYGFSLSSFPEELKPMAYNIHKLIGLTILALMLLRLIWALFNPKPILPLNTPRWQRIGAHSVHYLFYILLIAMPLSGWLMSSFAGKNPHLFGFTLALPVSKSKSLADFFEDIHFALAITIIGLLCLHILAALKQHFIDKTNVLIRMLPFKTKNPFTQIK